MGIKHTARWSGMYMCVCVREWVCVRGAMKEKAMLGGWRQSVLECERLCGCVCELSFVQGSKSDIICMCVCERERECSPSCSWLPGCVCIGAWTTFLLLTADSSTNRTPARNDPHWCTFYIKMCCWHLTPCYKLNKVRSVWKLAGSSCYLELPPNN